MRTVWPHPQTPTLRFLVLILAPYVTVGHSRITWISPADGDIYQSGNHLVGEWSVDGNIISPLFRLCNYINENSDKSESFSEDDNNCGTPVRPVVHTQGNGTYQILLAVPNVTSPYSFLLEMEGDDGTISTSPAFIFAPVSEAGGLAPLSSLNDDKESSNATIVHPVGSRRSTSPAAYIVPLCVAGGIVAIATIVGLHHWSKLTCERSIQSEEYRSFKSQFTDNLGRLRGLSMWASQLTTGISRGQPTVVQKGGEEDIFTPAFLPYRSDEKRHGLKRPRSTTREPFCPRRYGSSIDAASVLKAAASPRSSHVCQAAQGNLHTLQTVAEDPEAESITVPRRSLCLQAARTTSPMPAPPLAAHLRKYVPNVYP